MRTFLFRTSFLCLSSLLVSCGGGGGGSSSATAPAATAEWTYMVYLAGDNNLSAAAIADINEMEQSGSSDKVNVVVQAEFSPTYTPTVPGLTKSNSPAVRDGINIGIGFPGAASGFASVRGRIIKDFDPAWISSPLQSLGSNVDMGKAQTLTDFINWSKQNYPAKNYALVLWSHGDGWKVKRDVGGVITRGALADDTSGSFMSVPDIAKAVKDSGISLQVLNFDACLMGMYEVAHAFIGLADYLVASEEVEPSAGDDYKTLIGELKAKPSMAPLDLSVAIARTYRSSYASDPDFRDDAVTKSVVRLAAMPELQDTVESLAAYAGSHLVQHRIALQAARSASVSYANNHSHDLWDFLIQLEAQASVKADADLQNLTGAVKLAHMQAVVDSRIHASSPGSPVYRSRGLAIFLPQNTQITQDELQQYSQLSSSLNGRNKWRDLVNLMVNGDVGGLLEKVEGNFAFTLRWDDPSVDIDLYVNEPEDLYAPYMGVRTPNGFFSPDSSESGEPMESYVADELVQKGDYDIFVSYYSGSGPTQVDLYYSDASTVETKQFSQKMLIDGLPIAPIESNPLNDAGVAAGSYSDWWYPRGLTRHLGANLSFNREFQLPDGKRVVVHFNERRAKLKRRLKTVKTGTAS